MKDEQQVGAKVQHILEHHRVPVVAPVAQLAQRSGRLTMKDEHTLSAPSLEEAQVDIAQELHLLVAEEVLLNIQLLQDK
jgi:hypothetical protein